MYKRQNVDWRTGAVRIGHRELQRATGGDVRWQLCIHLGRGNIIDERRLSSDAHRNAVEHGGRVVANEIRASPTLRSGREVRSVNLDPGARRDARESTEGRSADHSADRGARR